MGTATQSVATQSSVCGVLYPLDVEAAAVLSNNETVPQQGRSQHHFLVSPIVHTPETVLATYPAPLLLRDFYFPFWNRQKCLHANDV